MGTLAAEPQHGGDRAHLLGLVVGVAGDWEAATDVVRSFERKKRRRRRRRRKISRAQQRGRN